MLGKLVTVNTTRLVLVDGGTGKGEDPIKAIIRPATSTVFLGGETVTAATGFPLASTDAPLTVECDSEKLYAIAAGAVVVQVLVSGL
jgi:hypothetical protein